MKKRGEIRGEVIVTDEDGFSALKDEVFWRWRALDAECRAHQMELSMLGQKIESELQANPPLAKLFTRKATAGNELSVAKAALNDLLANVTGVTGIPAPDLIINDKTGRLYAVAADGKEPQPVAPAQRARKTNGRKKTGG